jgi:hypothetical protein
MKDDPVVEEVRRARSEYAARFGFDLHAICEDLRRLTEESRVAGQQVVSLPPKRPTLALPPSPRAAQRAG